ncbi:MAG: hypothetical protein SV422_01310 [Pseudomonadota bacterium]|nr:hypothetical protein [Pseudomonadota bacterium]
MTVATTSWLVVAGCGAAHQRNDVSQAVAGNDVVYVPDLTAGIIDQPRRNASTATLVATRTGVHDGFDRIVFEFDEHVPGYHIEYIDRPVRKCGSGDVTQVAGDGWLEVRMSPAKAHTDEGRPTLTVREHTLNLAVLSELEMTCDFEGIVTWVAGVASPNRYQVRELDNPPRLVVDILTRAPR